MIGRISLAAVAAASMWCITSSTEAAEPFTDEAAARGVNFTVDPGAPFGCGVAFADLDGDSDPDLVLLGRGAGGLTGTIAVYENNGLGYFSDRTARSGISSPSRPSSITAVDFDADGDLDLHIGAWLEPDLLLCNEGNWTFRDVAWQPAMGGMDDLGAAVGCGWGDVNLDGWPDLYVGNRTGSVPISPPYQPSNEENRLYINQAGAGFVESAGAYGVNCDDDRTFQASFFDFDRDGDPDLYIANDKGASDNPPCSYRNRLYENVNGSFVDISQSSGTNGCIDSMCIALGDLDANGYLDVYVSNIPLGNPLYMNNGDGTFLEASDAYGVASYEVGWGSLFFDWDNDTFLDLYVCQHRDFEPNRLFEYDGTGPAVDIAGAMGVADNKQSFCVAAADIDDDGDIDLVVNDTGAPTKLFINNEGSGRNWAKFDVIGHGPNTFGVGTIVEARSGSHRQVREVVAGSGFKSQDDLTLHVGLDQATGIDEIRVSWPIGGSRILTGYPVNETISLYPTSRLGDADGDGVVDDVDYAALAAVYGDPVQIGSEMMDFDGDGDIDSDDATAFLTRYVGAVHDCNQNGRADLIDLLENPGVDADGTLIPDECERLGDLDGDGIIGVSDWSLMQFAWGPCPVGAACPADLNGDGDVGIFDLLVLLGNWS